MTESYGGGTYGSGLYGGDLFPSLSHTIGGVPVSIREDQWQLQTKLNERWRLQVYVIDYAGNQFFSYGEQVQAIDSTLGTLFTGFVADIKQDKSLVYGIDPYMEHQLDCIDNHHRADKRTSNRLYTVPTSAGAIVLDMLRDVLAAEGVQAEYALLEAVAASDWNSYTNAGTAGMSNLPGGDLELAPAGSVVTKTDSTTANWAAGTLTNVTAANNQLTLSSISTIKLTGMCSGNPSSNINYTIWTGNYTIATGDVLQYTMWIDGSSANQIAFIHGHCSNSANTGDIVDEQFMTETDSRIKDFASNQWYTRFVGLDAIAGSNLVNVWAGLTGGSSGIDTAYFHSIKIMNGATTKLTIFSSSLNANFIAHLYGYTNVKMMRVSSYYPATGSRISPSTSLAGVGILQSGYLTYSANVPAGTSLTVSTSVSGGATWTEQANNTYLANLLAGADATNLTLLTKEELAITGNDPTVTPSISTVQCVIRPSYTATKSDVRYSKYTTTDFGAGTLTNLIASADATLTLNGIWRNWQSGFTPNQTLFGVAGPSQVTEDGSLRLSTGSIADVRSRFDFAGQWNVFDAQITVDIPNTGNTTNCGLTYATTNWGNNNDSYAYNASISDTTLLLAKGTNSTGAGGFTSLASFPFTAALAQGSRHTLRVQWNGTGSTVNGIPAHTHNIYMDGVLYISQVDASYTAAGYIGARLFNTSGATQVGHFDDFSVVSTYTNTTWVSPNYSLNSVGTCGNSLIIWNAIVPNPSVILVETSIDGQSTWQTATNGGQIVGLTDGVSLVGKNLNVRITFTESPGNETVFQGFTCWVMSHYSSSGTWTTSALSLAPVGQVGSTLVSWAGLLAANTSVFADTSIDGGSTWASNVAPATLVTSDEYTGSGQIGGINTQPDPTTDNFNTNSSANYTTGNETGGSAAAWSYTATANRLTATGGLHAIDYYTSLSGKNVDLLCDMDESDAGGLVFCRSDATHWYSVVVGDNLSSVGTKNTITLYRNGVSVGSASIVFHRGLFYRVRATMFAGTITVSFDGNTAITYTDGSPLPAGTHGLYNDGGTARFSYLWIQPLGDNVASTNVLTRLRLSSTDPTATPQIEQITIAAYGPQIGPGVLIPSADYRDTFVDKNLDDASTQSNYTWWIDQNNGMNFNGRQTKPAPWILQSNSLALPSDLDLDTNFVVENAADQYRNRQKLKNVIFTAIFTDTFVGNSSDTSFTLRYPIATGTFPTITLNGNKQTVGLKGTTGSNWYYAEGDTVIAQDSSGTAIAASDLLIVSPYTGTYTDTLQVDNVAAQTALAAKEGGTGIVEAVEDVASKNMTSAAALTYANQLLTRYCIVDANNLPTGRTITFATQRNGLWVGQALPVQIPEENLLMTLMQIVQIDATMQVQPNNTVLYTWIVQASELPPIASPGKLLASGLSN